MPLLRSLLILCAVLSASAHAATRDFPLKWSQELTTVDGDPIERIEAFRAYTSDGVFVQLIPGDVRSATIRANVPWGRTCFVLTSSYLAPDSTSGQMVEHESARSEVKPSGCFTVQPGKPTRPEIQ